MTDINSLIESLDDLDEISRRVAAFGLGDLGEEAIPALLQALNDARPHVRYGAAHALGRIRIASSDVLSGLTHAMSDMVPRVRERAAESLSNLGEAAVPSIVTCLREENPTLQAAAPAVLQGMGTEGCKAITELLRLLSHDDKFVRIQCGKALGKIVPPGEGVLILVDRLREAVDKHYSRTAESLIFALEASGDRSPEVVKAIKYSLSLTDHSVKERAIAALKQISPEDDIRMNSTGMIWSMSCEDALDVIRRFKN